MIDKLTDKELVEKVAKKAGETWYKYDSPEVWEEIAKVIIPIIKQEVAEEIKRVSKRREQGSDYWTGLPESTSGRINLSEYLLVPKSYIDNLVGKPSNTVKEGE